MPDARRIDVLVDDAELARRRAAWARAAAAASAGLLAKYAQWSGRRMQGR
jgi:dihydroxy-acid dehydratase